MTGGAAPLGGSPHRPVRAVARSEDRLPAMTTECRRSRSTSHRRRSRAGAPERAARSAATSSCGALLIIPTVFILVTMVFFFMRLHRRPDHGGARRPAPRRPAAGAHPRGGLRPAAHRAVPRVPRAGASRATSARRITDNQPVVEVLLTYGAATLELALYALLVAFIVGIPLGMIAAARRDRWHGCRAPRGRDPLLRDARVLRRPRAEAHLLGLARLAPGRAVARASAPSSRSSRGRRHRHLPHRRASPRATPRTSPTCCCTRSSRRSRWAC